MLRLMQASGLYGLALGVNMSPGEITEPYQPLHGFDEFGNPPVPASPDPLVTYSWADDGKVNLTALQYYVSRPLNATTGSTTASLRGLDSVASDDCNVTFVDFCSFMVDFGVERAAWLEFSSPDLSGVLDSGLVVKASLSEYAEPWFDKTMEVTQYSDGKFRLETNDELYEGLRYAWCVSLHYTSS